MGITTLCNQSTQPVLEHSIDEQSMMNHALVYTATLNTAIQKGSATPITAKTNTNVERQHEKKTSQFSFFQNQYLKCFYSHLSTLKSAIISADKIR